MYVKVKRGVTMSDLNMAMTPAVAHLASLYKNIGKKDMVITSTGERRENNYVYSKHPYGFAFDTRIWGVQKKQDIVNTFNSRRKHHGCKAKLKKDHIHVSMYNHEMFEALGKIQKNKGE
jgi:hypothetical protein